MVFDPTSISGNVLWLSCNDYTWVSTDSSATSNSTVLADHTPIARWFDHSSASIATPNLNDAIQSNSTLLPYYRTISSLNPAVGYLSFNLGAGLGDSLISEGARIDITALLSTLTGSYSFTFVYKQRNILAPHQIFGENAPSVNGKFNFLNNTGTFWRFNLDSGGSLSGSHGHVITYTFAADGGFGNTGTESFYIDGVLIGVPVHDTTPVLGVYTTLCLGASATINSFGAMYALVNTEFYAVVAYSQALSDFDRVTLEAYLGGFYQIPVFSGGSYVQAGTLSASNVLRASQTITSTAAIGGTPPYTYQLYRSLSDVSLGSAIIGATGLVTLDSGLTPQTDYFYTIQAQDTAHTIITGAGASTTTFVPTKNLYTVTGQPITFVSGANTSGSSFVVSQLNVVPYTVTFSPAATHATLTGDHITMGPVPPVSSVQLDAPTAGGTNVNLAFLGDQITIHVPVDGAINPAQAYVSLLTNAYPTLSVTVSNQATNSQRVHSLAPTSVGGGGGIIRILDRWTAANFDPDFILWTHGTEDAFRIEHFGFTETQFRNDIAAIAAAIYTRFPLVKLVINDILWRGVSSDFLTHIQNMNTDYATLVAANLNFMVLGANHVNIRYPGNSDYDHFLANYTTQMQPDHFFPNALGVQNLAQLWFNTSGALIGQTVLIRPKYSLHNIAVLKVSGIVL